MCCSGAWRSARGVQRSKCAGQTTQPGCCMSASALRSRESAAPTTPSRSRTRSSCGGKTSQIHLLDLESPRGSWYQLPCPRRRSMNAEPQDLKAELLRTDEEFHKLAVKHHELEDRLHELTGKHYLSEPEQLEEVTLKKRKLQLKDRMEDIMRRHRQDHAHG